jgi:GTP-binding protein
VKDQNPPRAKGSKLPKIFYATQVGTGPPTFVIFVNEARLFSESYRRYMEHAFRKALGLDELPIVLHLRGKSRDAAEGRSGSRSGARPRPGKKQKKDLPRRSSNLKPLR